MQRRRRLPNPLGRLFRISADAYPATEALPIVDDAAAVRILDFAVRLGETMLVTGAPASEVTFAIVRAAGAYGLHPVHVDVTYNSITAAYHRSGEDRPITLLRVVRAAAPDYEKLLRLQALLNEVTSGLALPESRARLTGIRRTPFSHRPIIVVAAQGLLAVGVAIMFGGNPVVTVLAFLAAALAALTQFGLARARVPFFFSQITAAAVLTLFASLAPALAGTGLPGAADARPSVIVASAIVLMLAGLTVVGAAQDAIDGFALTASGRILELTTQTLGVVIGILVGLQVASLVGLTVDPPSEALPLGAIPLQFLGAALIAVSVAVINGSGMRIIIVSAALSVAAWTGYLLASLIGLDTAAASGVGALAGSFIGILLAYRLHVPSVAVTAAAILPMVPGAMVFRGLLTLVQSGEDPAHMLVGFGTLVNAGVIGIALAVGASLGIYLGQPVRATLTSVMNARARFRI